MPFNFQTSQFFVIQVQRKSSPAPLITFFGLPTYSMQEVQKTSRSSFMQRHRIIYIEIGKHVQYHFSFFKALIRFTVSKPQDILLSGQATFSSCKGVSPAQLRFQWTSSASANAQACISELCYHFFIWTEFAEFDSCRLQFDTPIC
jgi:hypothetical protein